jgi:hypothetical protein
MKSLLKKALLLSLQVGAPLATGAGFLALITVILVNERWTWWSALVWAVSLPVSALIAWAVVNFLHSEHGAVTGEVRWGNWWTDYPLDGVPFLVGSCGGKVAALPCQSVFCEFGLT